MAKSRLISADTMGALFGQIGVSFVSVIVMISTFGSLMGSMLASPRIFFAMADDKLLFEPIARVHPKWQTPYVAISLACVLGVAMVMTQTFEQLTDTFVLAMWPFYAMSVAAIYTLRKSQPNLNRPYKVIGYPVVPAIFIAAAIYLVVNALITDPKWTSITFGVVLLGLPVLLRVLLTRSLEHSRLASVDDDGGAADPAGFRRREKRDRGADFFRRAESPNGSSCFTNAAMPSGSACCRFHHDPPSNRIDPAQPNHANPILRQLLRQRFREADLRRFHGVVGHAAADSRPKIDDDDHDRAAAAACVGAVRPGATCGSPETASDRTLPAIRRRWSIRYRRPCASPTLLTSTSMPPELTHRGIDNGRSRRLRSTHRRDCMTPLARRRLRPSTTTRPPSEAHPRRARTPARWRLRQSTPAPRAKPKPAATARHDRRPCR